MKKNLKKIEIKLIILGSEKVGKKSIVKRLKILNSSETKEIPFNNTIPNDSEIDKIFKLKQSKNKSKIQIKEEFKRDLELKKIAAFKKIFTIGEFYIEINPIIGVSPEPISDNDNQIVVEDLEEFEIAHKIKFDKVKKQIEDVFNGFYDNSNNYKTEENKDENKQKIIVFDHVFYLFAFAYDLSDLNSFEMMNYYYEKLENTFKLQKRSDVGIIFIGNKIDVKQLYYNNNEANNNHNNSNSNSNNMDNSKFNNSNEYNNINEITTNNKIKDIYAEYFSNLIKKAKKNNVIIKNYEISTFMYFSFEKLFENIFYSIIGPKVPSLNESYIVERFKNVLYNQRS